MVYIITIQILEGQPSMDSSSNSPPQIRMLTCGTLVFLTLHLRLLDVGFPNSRYQAVIQT